MFFFTGPHHAGRYGNRADLVELSGSCRCDSLYARESWTFLARFTEHAESDHISSHQCDRFDVGVLPGPFNAVIFRCIKMKRTTILFLVAILLAACGSPAYTPQPPIDFSPPPDYQPTIFGIDIESGASQQRLNDSRPNSIVILIFLLVGY